MVPLKGRHLGTFCGMSNLLTATVPFTTGDFIPMPSKSVTYRGLTFSRSTLIRLWGAKAIKTTKLRYTGSTLGRRVILRESLDAFIDSQVAENLS